MLSARGGPDDAHQLTEPCGVCTRAGMRPGGYSIKNLLISQLPRRCCRGACLLRRCHCPWCEAGWVCECVCEGAKARGCVCEREWGEREGERERQTHRQTETGEGGGGGTKSSLRESALSTDASEDASRSNAASDCGGAAGRCARAWSMRGRALRLRAYLTQTVFKAVL